MSNATGGSIIKYMRQSRKLTQAELAKLVGISRTSICQMEADNQTISLDRLFKIADVLGYKLKFGLTPKVTT